MKFDWYQASVPEVRPQVVMDALARSDYYGQWQESRPIKGYDVGAQFVVGDQVVYRISHGGQNEQYGPNVTGTGGAAPRLAEVLREQFPKHRVSRVDACEDYHHVDVYRYLRKKALKIAKENKVYCEEINKPIEQENDGRTLYLGARSSAISLRIYEKGKQLGLSPDWVRAELQLRPQKRVKNICAQLSPLDIWAIAKWSYLMAREMGNKDLERVDATIYQQSDHDRAYHFMLKQYRKVLEQKKDLHGSWETVGAQIGHDLASLLEDPPIASLKSV